VLLRNPKYHRNALLFNFGLVLRSSPGPYEPLLHKIAGTLRTMEQESEFISSGRGLEVIKALCQSCLENLNSSGLCEFNLDAGNTVYLKLQTSQLHLPPLPPPHAVPIAIVSLAELDTSSWDLSVLLVAKWIDGVNCISEIAKQAAADIHVVSQTIRTMLAYKVVSITDPPLSCNRYACTAKASTLCWSPLGQACCKALGIAVSSLPSVALLYGRMQPSETFKDTLVSCAFPIDNAPFDIKQFVTFGLLNGIIRRVRPYLFRKEQEGKTGEEEEEEEVKSVDQYIVEQGLPLDEKTVVHVLDKLSTDPTYTILYM
jgi:hypothetical protein